MADQVNPTGSLAPGLSLAFLAVSAPRQAPERPRPAKVVDAQPKGPEGGPPVESTKASEAAVDQINHRLQRAGSELKVQADEVTGRIIFKVVNPTTGEVVLQVPSEEVLTLARNLRAMEDQKGAPGVLVNKEG